MLTFKQLFENPPLITTVNHEQLAEIFEAESVKVFRIKGGNNYIAILNNSCITCSSEFSIPYEKIIDIAEDVYIEIEIAIEEFNSNRLRELHANRFENFDEYRQCQLNIFWLGSLYR